MILVSCLQKQKAVLEKYRLMMILGSIISVVGKTTVEIIELFECRQKSRKNYNEKRLNHH